MATANEKAIVLGEEALAKATENIKEAIDGMEIVIDIPWHRIAIAGAVAAGVGALTFAVFSKLEDLALKRDYERMCEELAEQSETDISEEDFDQYGNTDGDADFFPSTMKLPYGLEKDPEKIEEYEIGYSKKEDLKPESINPNVEVRDSFDDFGDRLDGYEQYVCTYFMESDVVAYFDEAKEEFVEVNTEAAKQAMEILSENPEKETVYAVDHFLSTAYEISLDDKHTYEEVIDDARI